LFPENSDVLVRRHVDGVPERPDWCHLFSASIPGRDMTASPLFVRAGERTDYIEMDPRTQLTIIRLGAYSAARNA